MRRIGILIFLVVCGLKGHPIEPIDLKGYLPPEAYFLTQADTLTQSQQSDVLLASIRRYEQLLEEGEAPDSTSVFRQLAFSYAQLGKSREAASYIRRFLHSDFRPGILASLYFDSVRSSPEFREIESVYTPQHSFWSYVYLYVGLIGFYIAILLFLHNRIDGMARYLLGSFVLIHSVFILHICLAITNYQFEFPHTYLISTGFSFLYGPLLYLYFKRTTQKYRLRPLDLLHLAPTLVLVLYLIPIYSQTAGAKLDVMLDRVLNGVNPSDSSDLVLIVAAKLGSLIFYGWLIRMEFIREIRNSQSDAGRKNWMRNIYGIHLAYIVCYGIYGLLIIYQDHPGGWLYHVQVLSMSLMVLFVGYFASLRPQVFGSRISLEHQLLNKYRKSGLTDSLSLELRDKLLQLMDREQVFRENDLNLDGLAQRMETTRHNASQVINEHFGLSFHELINKYRIEQARYLLRSDPRQNLNIIDIAYEVGYNNKVTFNKAFKKDTGLTPSQYQSRTRALQVNQA